MIRGNRRAALVALAVLVGVVGAACSSDDGDADTGTSAADPKSTTSAAGDDGTETTVAGGPDGDGEGWDGEIRALSYNVAGLPDILSGSNPENNTDLIGPLLNDFDLVLLQETWKTPDPNPLAPTRVYHEILEGHSTHAFKSQMADQPLGTNPERESAFLADGLGVFSEYEMGPTTRVAWTGCFGGADTGDGGAGDCLAMKGFSVATITLADGVEVDVYDLHAEAGRTATDQELQRADFEQLAAFIQEHSAGRAIILGGDTNLHTDEEPDNPQDVEDTEIWESFLAATGLTDACAAVGCDDVGRIDKFAFRSGDGVELGVISRSVETDRFTGPDGDQLSDHKALAATFGWRRA